jgi:hypothetical protein
MKIYFHIIIIYIQLLFSFQTNAQEISPYLVGTNLWYTNPGTTVWNLTKQGGFQTIRIGGAEYDRNMPDNATILNWVKQIQAIGAEPVVQVSQYKSAAAAASLVKYLNIDKKDEIRPVKYWNIGNEPWLQNHSLAGGVDVGGMVETYFKPISAAMKEIDPTIKIYGPDFCYYVEFAINDLFGGKNNIAGKVPGKEYYYCDGISWHSYPQQDNIDLAYQGYESFKSAIIKCSQKVDATNIALNRTGDDAISWGIGEFNAKGGPVVHTWGNGQMFGGIMGLCMKYGAKYATTWSMFENGGNRQGTDFSMIDGAHMTPRATYRHMEFAAKYFKGKYADGISSSNDFIVYGAKNEEQISVMVMHRGYGYPKDYVLSLNNTNPDGTSVKLRVDADSAFTYNDIIGERTTHVLIFRGDSIIKISYSSDDFDKEIAPTMSMVISATILPNSPSGFKATSDTYNTATLTWTDDSDNELGFIVEREMSGVFKAVAVTPANVITFSDTGLTPETQYRYRVVAYNSLGKSDYSEADTVTTLETPALKAFKGPHSIPGKIEAEDFNDNEEGIGYHDTDLTNKGGQYRNSVGVDIEKSTDTGLGYNLAYIENGEWLSYLIDSVTPGTYTIALRLASNSTSTKRIDVLIDTIKVGQVVPVNTAGWQNWETKFINNVEIKDSQPKLLKLNLYGSGFNINWIEFISINTSSHIMDLNKSVKAWYDGNNRQIHLSANTAMAPATVQVFNALGQSFYHEKMKGLFHTAITVSDWPTGIYMVSVSNNYQQITTKLIIE